MVANHNTFATTDNIFASCIYKRYFVYHELNHFISEVWLEVSAKIKMIEKISFLVCLFVLSSANEIATEKDSSKIRNNYSF